LAKEPKARERFAYLRVGPFRV